MKSIFTLFSKKSNSSFIFNLNFSKPVVKTNYTINNDNQIIIDMINQKELSLKRSLKHLELINHLENCDLTKGAKYFPEDFLREIANNKYEAKLNAIRASREMILNAA
jgi:hypothetical protein